jgi:hypothetical protein
MFVRGDMFIIVPAFKNFGFSVCVKSLDRSFDASNFLCTLWDSQFFDGGYVYVNAVFQIPAS